MDRTPTDHTSSERELIDDLLTAMRDEDTVSIELTDEHELVLGTKNRNEMAGYANIQQTQPTVQGKHSADPSTYQLYRLDGGAWALIVQTNRGRYLHGLGEIDIDPVGITADEIKAAYEDRIADYDIDDERLLDISDDDFELLAEYYTETADIFGREIADQDLWATCSKLSIIIENPLGMFEGWGHVWSELGLEEPGDFEDVQQAIRTAADMRQPNHLSTDISAEYKANYELDPDAVTVDDVLAN